MIEVINLTEAEQALHDAICWDEERFFAQDQSTQRQQLAKMEQLTQLLLGRNAVLDFRRDYFFDPEFNIGGHGKSRAETFERNGCAGNAICRHPHFMKYLRYWLRGPCLPGDTISGFCRIVDDDEGTSGMMLDQLRSFVRKEVRGKGLEKHDAAEEFFKLAHELQKPDLAEPVRSAALEVRSS